MFELPPFDVIDVVPKELFVELHDINPGNYWNAHMFDNDQKIQLESTLYSVFRSIEEVKELGNVSLRALIFNNRQIEPGETFDFAACTWHEDNLTIDEGYFISDHNATQAVVGTIPVSEARTLVGHYNWDHYSPDARFDMLGNYFNTLDDQELCERHNVRILSPPDYSLYKINSNVLHRSPTNETAKILSRKSVQFTIQHSVLL